MNRGDVYLTGFRFPNRAAPGQFTVRDKYVVILRGVAAETDVPFLIASTRRDPNHPPRPFEVAVGAAEGFPHDTLIDCRWPYTLPKSWFSSREYRFTLPSDVMRDVSVALVIGLEMRI